VLAGQCGRFQQRAPLVASAGETDPDFIAAENRMLALGGRMFLIEDLALAGSTGRCNTFCELVCWGLIKPTFT
jgi:hypothetical protein